MDRDFYFDYSVATDETYYQLPSFDFQHAFGAHLSPVVLQTWELRGDRFFVSASPRRGVCLPAEGFKFHVSTLLRHAQSTLAVVSDVCAEESVPFKFAGTPDVLEKLLSRNCSPDHYGKFITVYPLDQSPTGLRMLGTRLANALREFTAPYNFTDLPYPDSRVLSYRYGAFTGHLSAEGGIERVITFPDGTVESDTYETPVPSWCHDPFQRDGDSDGENGDLLANRWCPWQLVKMHTQGTVFEAIDTHTDKGVIVKQRYSEAHLLETEYAILRDLPISENFPVPLGLFREGEHTFLVTNKVPGVALDMFFFERSPLMPSALLEYTTAIALTIARLHGERVVHQDLKPDNVLIGTDACAIVDFETAAGLGEADPAADVLAFGKLVFFLLWPVSELYEMLAVRPELAEPLIALAVEEGRLHKSLGDLILACFLAASQRPTIFDICERLSKIRAPADVSQSTVADLDNTSIAAFRRGILSATGAVTQPHNDQAFFPAPPRVYTTNGLGHLGGTAGALQALHRLGQERTGAYTRAREWLLNHPDLEDATRIPPGVATGFAGIAGTLLTLGETAVAQRLFRKAVETQLPLDASLYYGWGGIVLTGLHFYQKGLLEKWHLQRLVTRFKAVLTTHDPDADMSLETGTAGIGLVGKALARSGFLSWEVIALEHIHSSVDAALKDKPAPQRVPGLLSAYLRIAPTPDPTRVVSLLPPIFDTAAFIELAQADPALVVNIVARLETYLDAFAVFGEAAYQNAAAAGIAMISRLSGSCADGIVCLSDGCLRYDVSGSLQVAVLLDRFATGDSRSNALGFSEFDRIAPLCRTYQNLKNL